MRVILVQIKSQVQLPFVRAIVEVELHVEVWILQAEVRRCLLRFLWRVVLGDLAIPPAAQSGWADAHRNLQALLQRVVLIVFAIPPAFDSGWEYTR